MSKSALVAVVLIAGAGLGAERAAAQSPCPACGPQVPIKNIDKQIATVASEMGLVRSIAEQVGQLHTMEYVGTGTMVDAEATNFGQPIQVTEYRYVIDMQRDASRLTVKVAGMPDTIRVVKAGRGWNETWSVDHKKLTTSPVDAATAAFRAQMIWVQPQAFLEAVVFAAGKKCLGTVEKACTTPYTIGQEGGQTVFTVEVNGHSLKGWVDAKNRIGKVETTIDLPGGVKKKMVATYTDYKTGETDAAHDPAYGNAVDKFHNGTYWPTHVVEELDGTKILDITVIEGWGNPYTIFPDPELLAKAQ